MAADAGRDALVAARVALIAGKPDVPAFSQQIEETLQVLADEDHATFPTTPPGSARLPARPAPSATAAVTDVLGFSCDDLGRAVASRWGMPPVVGASMAACSSAWWPRIGGASKDGLRSARTPTRSRIASRWRTRLGAHMCGALPIVVTGWSAASTFDRTSSVDACAPDIEAGLRRLRDRAALVMSRSR